MSWLASVFTIGLLGLFAWPFAPMHQRTILAAGGGTLQDTMHLVLSGADTFLFFLAMIFGAGTSGRRFRMFSLATIAVVLACGAYTGMSGAKVSANDPTPWLGVTERIAVFGSMLWIAVASICLMSRPERR
uniref:Uncharacterized protein n=1 Tax=uncultured bacterium 5G4 TaxID=1701326 RepID=A0A166H2Q9_9BACT|nr:hypothetical protein 5G4_008 [uncultured bacterium 5G4]